MFAIGSEVIVKSGTPHDWLGQGDPDRIHWASGHKGVVIRPSRTDVVLRVKFDRSIVPHGQNSCQWFHPDELEVADHVG